MKLILTGFSQDVSFDNTTDSFYLLTFQEEVSGEELRIQVSQDTIAELVQKTTKFRTGAESVPQEEPEEPDEDLGEPEGAEAFDEREATAEEEARAAVAAVSQAPVQPRRRLPVPTFRPAPAAVGQSEDGVRGL